MWVGLACGAALGLGGIVAVDAATESADAQGGFKVTPGQLQINQKISQAAVRRANRNRSDIEALQRTVGANGGATGPQGPAGPQGPQGPQGPAGSDASINGVAAGGDLTGTYPNPGLASRSVGAEQLDAPLAMRLRGPDISLPEGTFETLPLEAPGNFGTFDTAGFFTPDAPTNATVPRSGIYRLSAAVSFFPDPDGSRTISFRRVRGNGILGLTAWRGAPSPEVDGGTMGVATLQLPAEAGDVFQVRARTNGAGNSLAANVQSFDIAYLGPLPNG